MDDLISTLAERARLVERRRGSIRALAFVLWNVVLIVVVASGQRLASLIGTTPKDSCGALGSLRLGLSANVAEEVLQGLRRSSASTLTCVAMLAIGVGASTAAFGLAEAVLLRPLPFADPHRLVALRTTLRSESWWSAGPADILDWRARSRSLESIGFVQSERLTVTGRTGSDRIMGALVSANLFGVLGIEPVVGRDFREHEDEAGARPVALLSEEFWSREHAANPAVAGGSIVLDGRQYEIVGVAPASVDRVLKVAADVLIPRPFHHIELQDRRRMLRGIGRLRANMTIDEARSDLMRVARAVQEAEPVRAAGWGVLLVPLQEELIASARSGLIVVAAAASFLLAICSLNTGNLLLLRWARRQPEIAVRRALGAGWGRSARGVALETVGIGLAAGLIGTGAAILWLATARPSGITGGTVGVGSSFVVSIVGMTLSLIVALLVAILPMSRIKRLNTVGVLQTREISSNPGPRDLRLQESLVAVQFAVAVTLLGGAMLAFQSLQNLRGVDPGFATSGKLVLELRLPADSYSSTGDASSFYQELRHRLRRIEGIRDAGAITSLPLTGGPGLTGYHFIDGHPTPSLGEETIGGWEQVSPGYFNAQGIRVLAGRDFAVEASSESPRVVIINQEMARRRWPAGDFLGQHIRFARPEFGSWIAEPYEVVGLVEDVRYELDASVRPRVYMRIDQAPVLLSPADFLIQVDLEDPLPLFSSIGEVIQSIDPRVAVPTPRTYADIRAGAIAPYRLRFLALGWFAALAATLAAAGLCAVAAQASKTVRRELSIRKALGASRADLLRTMARGWLPLAAGLAVGGGLVVTLPYVMSDVLFAVPSVSPLGLLLLLASSSAVALVASLVPTREALRVAPSELLRAE